MLLAIILFQIIFATPISAQPDNEAFTGNQPERGTVEWKFVLSGRGIAYSQEIHDESVYTGDSEGTFYALNANTGEVEWTFESGKKITDGPAIKDDRVYFTNIEQLYCLNANTGELLWNVLPPDNRHSKKGIGTNGPGISPALSGDRLIYGYKNQRNLYCFSPADGSLLWKTSFESGLHEDYAIKGDQVFVTTSNGLRALDAKTGNIQWKRDAKKTYFTAPAVSSSYVYVSDASGIIYAVDRKRGKTKWKQSHSTSPRVPALHDGRVYIAALRHIICFDAKTGEKKWTYQDRSRVEGEKRLDLFATSSMGGSMALSDQQIFAVTSYRGVLHNINADTGKKRWRKELGDTIFQNEPIVSNGSVYISRLVLNDEGEAIKGILYRINTDLPKSDNDWPTQGGNIGRTGTPPDREKK